jgi:hypothetical protein
LLEKFLKYDPSERITPVDAMEDPYFDPVREKGYQYFSRRSD